jgi:cystathionine beta-synthase
MKVAGKLHGYETIVVIFPDTGRNYLDKIYSDQWMRKHGFLED